MYRVGRYCNNTIIFTSTIDHLDLHSWLIFRLLYSCIQLFNCSVSFLQHHLKKLEGRRLDFDYKKKRQGKVCEDEIKQALEKFDDSKEIAEQSMFNILEGDVRT